MKKIIFALAIAVLINLLISCQNEPDPLHPAAGKTESANETASTEEPETDTFSEEDLAAFIGTSGKTVIRSSGKSLIAFGNFVCMTRNHRVSRMGSDIDLTTVLKYDAALDAVSTLCPDPVCSHKSGSGCPFGEDCQICAIEEGIVYYTSNYYWTMEDRKNKVADNNRSAVYSYDLKEMKQTLLFEVYRGNLLNLTSRSLYYITTVIDDDLNEHLYIGRYDLSSGKNELLFNYKTFYADENGNVHRRYEEGAGDVIPLFADNQGRLYFFNFTMGLHSNVYVAKPGKYDETVQITPECRNGYVYYRDGEVIVSIPDGPYIEDEDGIPIDPPYTIKAFDMETGESRVLVENAGVSFALAGDCIYYNPFVREKGSAPTVARYNIETKESALCHVLIDEPAILQGGCDGVIVRGKLITYGTFLSYPEQEEGTVEDYVAIDLRTGKWSYTHLQNETMYFG